MATSTTLCDTGDVPTNKGDRRASMRPHSSRAWSAEAKKLTRFVLREELNSVNDICHFPCFSFFALVRASVCADSLLVTMVTNVAPSAAVMPNSLVGLILKRLFRYSRASKRSDFRDLTTFPPRVLYRMERGTNTDQRAEFQLSCPPFPISILLAECILQNRTEKTDCNSLLYSCHALGSPFASRRTSKFETNVCRSRFRFSQISLYFILGSQLILESCVVSSASNGMANILSMELGTVSNKSFIRLIASSPLAPLFRATNSHSKSLEMSSALIVFSLY